MSFNQEIQINPFTHLNVSELPSMEQTRGVINVEITPANKRFVKKESDIYIRNEAAMSKMENKIIQGTRNQSHIPFLHKNSTKNAMTYSGKGKTSNL